MTRVTFQQQILRTGLRIISRILVLGSMLMCAPTQAIEIQELPFWPQHLTDIGVKPTGFDSQASSVFSSGLKVRGEGPGFDIIATSPKEIWFATPPRMEQAWKVSCQKIVCRIEGDTSQLQAPAFLAAKAYVALSGGTKVAKTRKKQEKPTETSKSKLPPINLFRSHRFKKIRPAAATLLQGFK